MRPAAARAMLGYESTTREVTVQEQRNTAAVRRFIERYQTAADEDAFDEVIHPNVVDHSRPPGIAEGAEGVRQQFDGFRRAFPDFRATILDQIAEGDKVVTRKSFLGTHGGDLFGVPATGRDVHIELIDIVRVSKGKIVEHWNIVDSAGLMEQLGAVSQ